MRWAGPRRTCLREEGRDLLERVWGLRFALAGAWGRDFKSDWSGWLVRIRGFLIGGSWGADVSSRVLVLLEKCISEEVDQRDGWRSMACKMSTCWGVAPASVVIGSRPGRAG